LFSSCSIAVLVSNVAARARTQAVAAIGRVRHRIALFLQPQARRHRTLDDVLWATPIRPR
jgi:hypothetical protein